MAKTAAKLNRTSCTVTRFKIPDNMFKNDFLVVGEKKMTPTGKLGYALVNSLAKKKRPAFLTYKNYEEVLECSPATTRKFIVELTESGKIEQDKSNRMYSQYTVLAKPGGKGYINFDRKYFDIINKHIKSPIHWTNSLELIVCRMIRHIISENTGSFVASIKQIANMVGISERCAGSGIGKLLKHKVIFRPEEYKGMYEGKASEYRFRTKLKNALISYEEERREEAKKKVQERRVLPQEKRKKPAAVEDADARADWERYHAENKNRAEDQAEQNLKRAKENPEFNQAEREIKTREIELARAEVYGTEEQVKTLVQRLAESKERRRNALKAIAMTDNDLIANYTCKKCSDTGFMKDGRMCDCYKPPRGSP